MTQKRENSRTEYIIQQNKKQKNTTHIKKKHISRIEHICFDILSIINTFLSTSDLNSFVRCNRATLNQLNQSLIQRSFNRCFRLHFFLLHFFLFEHTRSLPLSWWFIHS
jgi:hypothetical protein